jgi:hypothetical protein
VLKVRTRAVDKMREGDRESEPRYDVKRRRLSTVFVFGALVFAAGMPAASAALSISAPGAKNLGSAATGSATITSQLGTVTMSNTAILGLVSGMTATVSFSDFTTAGGGQYKTIPKASFSYWSGPSTANSGISLGNITPGQLTESNAVIASVAQTAFSTASLLQLGGVSVSFNPTIVLTIPASAIAGTYTGTVTHSVA